MMTIKGILLEPVGCLAEFPAEPFHEVAVRFYGRGSNRPLSKSASRVYWHVLNLMQAADIGDPQLIEPLEIQAVDRAVIYDDVAPALAELKAMGVKLCIASSLSGAAVARFLDKGGLHEYFSGVANRDNAKGIKAAPLTRVLAAASLEPEHAMYLADTAEALNVAKEAGVHPVLMMNDPDEAMRLTAHRPAGGIVSLHELPDFMRLLAAQSAAQ